MFLSMFQLVYFLGRLTDVYVYVSAWYFLGRLTDVYVYVSAHVFFGETHGCLCLCFSTCIFRRDSCMFLSIFQHMYF